MKLRITTFCLLLTIGLVSQAQEFIPYGISLTGAEKEIVMVPIKGGTYTMGSTDSKPDQQPAHEVVIHDFWIGETEITWEQYEAFVYDKSKDFVAESKLADLGIDGMTSATIPYVEMSFGMGKGNHPAVNMTQYAALMYCKWLTALTGNFYRLPTEAEWEFACRAGSDQLYNFGNESTQLSEYAVYNTEKYREVGSLKPGLNGLYDMSGNVAEWTMDQYDPDFYSRSERENPWNVPESLYPRTVRGGSWKSQAEDLTCTSRQASHPSWKKRDPQLPKSRWWHTNAPFVGFRIVRPLVTPSKKEIEKYWLMALDDYSE